MVTSNIALVTGAAGFIGAQLSHALLDAGWQVIGVDSMSDYYDVSLKTARIERLTRRDDFQIEVGKIETPALLHDIMQRHRPKIIVHLAAQAGVRYSIDNPRSYVDANLIGTYEVLESARAFPPEHILLASTSSAYGANETMPYVENMKADHQMSFYAATKKANESMAHSYAHLYGLPTTMFRFFTVYGPWGRPDMALFKFTKAILADEPIDVYNHGNMKRDFTYIDDLLAGIMGLIDAKPALGHPVNGDSLSPVAPFRIVNIGNAAPVKLLEFIEAIEAATGRTAKKNFLPMQPGDVPATWADTSLLSELTGYAPKTSVKDGVQSFVDWYRAYYKL